MALSNWDTLAINEQGESVDGHFISPMGVEVTVYKNWLYVSDNDAWVDGGAFIFPTIMSVTEGRLRYKDINIMALRGPQQGVYAAVWTETYATKETPASFTGMLGIGVYGWRSATLEKEAEWIGTAHESVQWYREKLGGKTHVREDLTAQGYGPEGRTHEPLVLEYEEWDVEVPDELRAIAGDLTGAVRFNQGDAFFANALGTNLSATAIEDEPGPLLNQIIGELE